MARAVESGDRRAAASNQARSLLFEDKYAEAEPLLRKLRENYARMFGPEHGICLGTATKLAQSLSGQNKFADAERIEREVLAVHKRVLGPEHRSTLTSAASLAYSL